MEFTNKINKVAMSAIAALALTVQASQAEEALGSVYSLRNAILLAIEQAAAKQSVGPKKGVVTFSSQDIARASADRNRRSLASLLDALAASTGSKACTLSVSFYNGQSPFAGKSDVFAKLGKQASVAQLRAKLNNADPVFRSNVDRAGASARYSILECYDEYQVTLSKQTATVKVGDTQYHKLNLEK